MRKFSFKHYLIVFCIALFVLGGAYLKFREFFLPEAVVKIAGQEISAEVARTPKAWARGLSGRKNLGENQGLLLVFPQPSQRGFWMKEMKFSLDIIWINDGKVIDIAPNVLPANNKNIPIYYPRLPARLVLEVNAGFSEKYGLKIGDMVEMLTE